MDLIKIGRLLCDLRKAKGMTQKEIADKLGIVPKTVSKWETGHGFPDVSALVLLADILGVSEKVLLSGSLDVNMEESGNMKRMRFYVCPECGSFMQGIGNCELICCGKPLEAVPAKAVDAAHSISVEESEDDYYITFPHSMSKEHYISFIAYVRFDRVLTVKLYPEQSGEVRIP